MRWDSATLILAVCLLASVAGAVVVVVLQGSAALTGTGLGALTAVLAGALAFHIRQSNGDGK